MVSVVIGRMAEQHNLMEKQERHFCELNLVLLLAVTDINFSVGHTLAEILMCNVHLRAAVTQALLHTFGPPVIWIISLYK